MPYTSKSSLLADQQLKVQELCIRFEDIGLYTQSGSVVTVDLGEPCQYFVSAMILQNAGPSVLLNAFASTTITNTSAVVDGVSMVVDSSLVITLLSALAAHDVLILKYVTQQ